MTPNKPSDIWRHCYTCRDYALKRREVLAGPLAQKARRERSDAEETVDRFMMAAHNRHVSTGEPLLPGGPTRVLDPVAGQMAALLAEIGHELEVLGDT